VRPDVVLLDIGLPKPNGYEAARRIREQRWSKQPVLSAGTECGQDEDRRLSHEAGFDHHLVKPVDPNVLMKLPAEFGNYKCAEASRNIASASPGSVGSLSRRAEHHSGSAECRYVKMNP
jgi:CheY-like chemotaxis protein